MSGFHNLEHFDVSENSFFGPFPTSLFTVPSLQWVSLEGNHFKGPIEFWNTSSSSELHHLYLSHNQFDGPIPESIYEFLNLEELHLSYNSFIGTITRTLSKLAKLGFLDLSNNNLEGQVPGCLQRLTTLELSHNTFSSFGRSWEALDGDLLIRYLNLNSNSFRGPFPHWICKIRPLLLLDLSNNFFSGSIPSCLRNSTNSLDVLILRNNTFSGTLPDIFSVTTESSIGLTALDVSHNMLEGKLPKSLINCLRMQFLNVGNNRIKDKFPPWLSSLPLLNVVILRSNEFYGSLYHPNVSTGFQSLRVIDISHNEFTGTLPSFYGWLEMTTSTRFGMYMGEFLYWNSTIYIDSMEMVNKGVEMEFERIHIDFKAIDFSGNRFCGNIHESIGMLKGLHLLNLSDNTLEGNIPQSLANLTNLEALDLSQNQLSGQIPQDLGSLSSLSYMNFSNNNLEGPIPRSTQFQSQHCSSFMNNPRLYGLEELCGKIHVPDLAPQQSEELLEPEQEMINWIASAIAFGPGVFCGLVIGHIFTSHKHEWFMEKFRGNKLRLVAISAR